MLEDSQVFGTGCVEHQYGSTEAINRKRATMPVDYTPTCRTQGQRLRSATSPTRLSPITQTKEGLYGMPRECGPDDLQAGGAFVVVCGGERPLHGEGRQFRRLDPLII